MREALWVPGNPPQGGICLASPSFWNARSVPPGYYNISGAQRRGIAGGYFGLIAALIAAMQWNEANKKPLHQLQEEYGEGSKDEAVLVDPYA